jgi:hypothetical protein
MTKYEQDVHDIITKLVIDHGSRNAAVNYLLKRVNKTLAELHYGRSDKKFANYKLNQLLNIIDLVTAIRKLNKKLFI